MIVLPKNTKFDTNSMNLQMSRSVEYFISGIKSKATERNYLLFLEKFREYNHIRDYDSLLEIEPETVKERIEDLVFRDKKNGLAKSSINAKISAIKLFYDMNDIDINIRRARKMLPAEKKQGGGKPYTTKQLQEMLKCLNTRFSLPLKCAVLIMISSGCRVGFTESLRIKHIGEFEKNGLKSILIYGGEKMEYTSFINPETIKVYDQWIEYRKSKGEIVNENSWVIPQATDHRKPMGERGVQGGIRALIEDIDRGEKIGLRYETSITHGIRKRWNTIAKNTDGVNANKVEKMYDHNSQTHKLDTLYFKPTIDELFEEYEKFVDKLAVSEEAILEVELKNKNKQIESSEAEKDDKIRKLEARLVKMEEFAFGSAIKWA